MSTPATSDEVRALLEEMRRHDEKNGTRIKGIYDKLDSHGASLARIEERTEQHEKRMDRADRRAATTGTIAGSMAGGILTVILSKLGFGGGA